MSLVYGLTLTCDLYFYCAILGTLGLLTHMTWLFLAAPVLLGIGAGLGFRLKERGEAVRFLPLLLGLLALLNRPGRAQLILTLPMLVYGWFYVRGNRHVTDHYYAMTRFRLSCALLGFCLLAMLMISPSNFVNVIPALFMFLALTITLLRMLRHDNHVIRQKRFQLINLAGIVGMCGIGVFLSTDIVLRAVRFVLHILYKYVLLKVLDVLLWVLKLLLEALDSIFSRFSFKMESGSLDMPMLETNQQLPFDIPENAEAMMMNPAVKRVLEILGIALLVVVALLILKKLSEQHWRGSDTESTEERESLDAADAPGKGLMQRLRERRDPVSGVRAAYRKYLGMAAGSGIELNGRQNSLQIRDLSADAFDRQALDDLRNVYIKARYDGAAGAEDVDRAKDALSRLKKKG